MNRRLARETAFSLLFEAKFHPERDMAEIYETAKTTRAIEEDDYVRTVIAGVIEHKEELDACIEKHSHGWKKSRISPVSLTVMELAVFEIYYCEDIPASVSMNEALELVKAYDEEAARAFVNGVLNAVVKEREAGGHAD
jgi:N utilization substance protein B